MNFHECRAMIAEVPFKNMGLGIEFGWADMMKVPIICAHRKGTKVPSSLKVISTRFVEYSNAKELVEGIEKEIEGL